MLELGVFLVAFLIIGVRYWLRQRWLKDMKKHAPEYHPNTLIFYDDEWDWRK